MIVGVGMVRSGLVLAAVAAAAGCYHNSAGDVSINPLAVVAPVYYERYEVRGQVVADDAAGTPVGDARVVLRLRNGAVIGVGATDAMGRFRIAASRSRARQTAGFWSGTTFSAGVLAWTNTSLVEHNTLAHQHPHYPVDIEVMAAGYAPAHRRLVVPLAVQRPGDRIVVRWLGRPVDEPPPDWVLSTARPRVAPPVVPLEQP